eukprot:SAG11_NODE_4259_length_1976_cov_1.444798_1_plen_427_part_10
MRFISFLALTMATVITRGHDELLGAAATESAAAAVITAPARADAHSAANSTSSFFVLGNRAVVQYNLGASTLSGLAAKWSVPGYVVSAVHFNDSSTARSLIALLLGGGKILVFDASKPGASAVRRTVGLGLGAGGTGGPNQPIGVASAGEKIFVALFNPGGVCEVDTATFAVRTCPFLHGHLVHNVHAFQIGGKTEIFISDLGNSLWRPYVSGNGLVHLDSSTCAFNLTTVVDLPTGGMHVRAAAQDIDDSNTVYAVTQEPGGQPTRLFVLKLVQVAPVGFSIAATIVLPKRGRNPGEGGADVISLGAQRVLVTDRFGAPGPGMLYMYDVGSLRNASSSGSLVESWPLGANPRHTTVVGAGAIVSANDKNRQGKDDDLKVSVYAELLNKRRNGSAEHYVIRNASAAMTFIEAPPGGASFILAALEPR